MKTVTLHESLNGTLLIKPDDGFIVHGSIMKGDNHGGLIGSGKIIEHLEKLEGYDPIALSNEEMLDILQIPLDVLVSYVENKTKLLGKPIKPKEDSSVKTNMFKWRFQIYERRNGILVSRYAEFDTYVEAEAERKRTLKSTDVHEKSHLEIRPSFVGELELTYDGGYTWTIPLHQKN